MCMRKIRQLLLAQPQLGAWLACALTGNQTCNLPVHRLLLDPLSHTSQNRSPHFHLPLSNPSALFLG